MDNRYESVLEFWFGPLAERHLSRKAWFQKDPDFDANIRTRFLPLFEEVEAGALDSWRDHPQASLALIILLDQFPRNLFRGQARAFACDPRARIITRHVIALGFDQAWHPVQRIFAYLPLEHSESLADQEECLRLMKALMQFPETADMHVWAEKHRVIIERFGRFPHRNAALGRQSTPEEIEFLKQPGSGF